MDKGLKFLSDLVFARTYAAKKPDGYKETWEEAVQRVIGMHCAKFPHLEAEIRATVEKPMLEKWVVPSMRTLQFAGGGVERENFRAFNCSYLSIKSFSSFAELFYILMNGTGVGYSVKAHHVAQLPKIPDIGKFKVFRIPDSKEGWADSVLKKFKNPWLVFDYSAIRPAGSPLSTGGTASGPEALMKLHEKMGEILLNALGRQLTPMEVSDIVCHIADGVVVGGVRRAALICLFDTVEMLTYKSGAWWEKNPQRARANISFVLLRDDPWAWEKYNKVMDACFASGSGEPGLIFANDIETGWNPCAEITLRDNGVCNLTEINWPAVRYNHQFYTALHAGIALGCLQASYTDFGYVNPEWKRNADDEALLGVSITGTAVRWDELINTLDVPNFKETVDYLTGKWAKLAGINPPKRTLTMKPSGTTGAFLGTPSGIHAAHSIFYIRCVRIDVSHPLAIYLAGLPEFKPFIELDKFNPSNYVISIPVQMAGAITRSQESAIDLLNRMKKINEVWVSKGHYEGKDTHNVSLTVSYKSEEEAGIKEWMWNNRNVFCGVSLLPYDGGTYVQAPFEEIDKETYERLTAEFPQIDLSSVNFGATVDERMGEAACQGGSCELV
jgi:ribonucleoside-diphosphate reductase alpha chain